MICSRVSIDISFQFDLMKKIYIRFNCMKINKLKKYEKRMKIINKSDRTNILPWVSRKIFWVDGFGHGSVGILETTIFFCSAWSWTEFHLSCFFHPQILDWIICVMLFFHVPWCFCCTRQSEPKYWPLRVQHLTLTSNFDLDLKLWPWPQSEVKEHKMPHKNALIYRLTLTFDLRPWPSILA